MKRVLMITTVLIFVWGSLFAQTESADPDSFHKAVAKSPVPGTIFLYPERIPLKDGGFFAAERGMMFVPVNRSFKKSAVIGIEVYHTYDHPGHLWNVYKPVAAEAEKASELQDLIHQGGLIEAIKTVIDRVRNKPVRITVIDPKTGKHQDVLFTVQEVRGLADGYSGGLPGWSANVITLYSGDFSKAAERALRSRDSRRFRTASFYMLDHGSGITSEREAELKSDPAVKILGNINSNYTMTRGVWGSDLGDEFRQNFETDIPTVIVHGTWDTSTPYENALELVPYFKNSKFIPVIRGPHGAIRAAMEVSEQFRKGIMHFAATGDMSDLPDKVEMPAVDWVIPEITKKKGDEM